MSKSVVFALGGTGGHIIPAQVTAEQLSAEDPNLSIQFVGHQVKRSKLIDHSRFDTYEVSSASFVWKKPFQIPHALWNISRGIWQAYNFLKQRKPQLVVGFGSYHSCPVLVAAVMLKIPIILHESNVLPGRVNRFFARWTKTMVITYAETRRFLKAPILHLRIPLRGREENTPKADLFKELSLVEGPLTLLVIGGSLGADYMNQTSIEAIEMLADQGCDLQVIHLCGLRCSADEISERYRKKGIQAYVRRFEPRMDVVYRLVDLALIRAGAMTIAEIIEQEIPAIVIPSPSVMENHQDMNADLFVEQVAGGVKLKQEFASPEKLLELLSECSQQGQLTSFKEKIVEFKRSMPVKSFVQYLRECL